jgi:PTH2 family peptidyl-tRNA hydrolase
MPNYKQIIIARKDLHMSPGKLAAQVAHGSMAFLTMFIRNNADIDGHVDGYIDQGIIDNLINDTFTKCKKGGLLYVSHTDKCYTRIK